MSKFILPKNLSPNFSVNRQVKGSWLRGGEELLCANCGEEGQSPAGGLVRHLGIQKRREYQKRTCKKKLSQI